VPRIDWVITGLDIRGGAEMFVRKVSPKLAGLGWDMQVITLKNGGSLIRDLRREGMPVVELGVSSRVDINSILRLRAIWKKNPPDLIHTHLFHAGIVGRISARMAGIRNVVIHQHGAEHNRSTFRSFLDRVTSSSVCYYVTSCKYVSGQLEKREMIPSRKIKIIYNGIDLPEANYKIPSSWPANDKEVIACFAGRLSYEKGLDVLLEALRINPYLLKNLQLLILGNGPELQELQHKCQEYQLLNRVHFVGQVESTRAWLYHSNIFVLPSRWEGISMALLEAMSVGLPVVATVVGGTPEVVVNDINGFLVPPNDAVKLGEAITRMVKDEQLRDNMGKAGMEKVKREFSLDKTILQLDTLYRGILYS